MPFDPKDWYWFVGGATTSVYASKRNIYVPIADADYVAWDDVYDAPPVADESEIWYYVKQFQPWWLWTGVYVSQPTFGQYRKEQLQNYNTDKRTREVAGGMTAAGIPVNTDDISRGLIDASRSLAAVDPDFTTQWAGSDGNFYPVDAPTMIAMADEVTGHTNDCYKVFAQVSNDITLNTITQPSEIDTAYIGL